MEAFTFEQLPQAVTQLFTKLENIERLLSEKTNNKQPEGNSWFDLAQLIEYLPDKPAVATVYGWVSKGYIPHHKRGKKLYFLKSEIDTWLRSGRKKTAAEIAAESESYISKKRR